MIRVAMITSAPYPPQEGIGFYSHQLARNLINYGVAVTLITRGSLRSNPRSTLDGIPVQPLRYAPLFPLHVHVHSVFVNRYLRSHHDDFDLIHAHSPLPAVPAVGLLPLVTTIHSSLQSDAKETPITDWHTLLIRLQTPVSVSIERRLIKRSAFVATLTPETARTISHHLDPDTPIQVMSNAVDTEFFTPRHGRREHNIVLSVGRLVHGKGLEDLLTAWVTVVQQHPEAELIIVGSGPLDGRLQQQAQTTGISSSIRFLGALGFSRRDELVELYRRARVVVQPSHHEGLSTVVLEGMACASAVIATAVGAHPRVIEDCVDGLLVPAHAPERLADAIGRVLSSPARATEMGRHARAKIERAYSWKSVAKSYRHCYDLVLQGSSRAD